MIRLDTYQRKLQALLGGAVTTNQPTAVVCYTDKENENQKKFFVESVVSTFNNATPVDICPAPDKAMVREIDSIHIRNNDTVAATVTVRVDDNGTSYEIVEVSVAAGETLLYTKDNGWSVISVYGQQTAVFNYIDFVSGTFPDAAQRLKWNDTDGTLEVGLKGGNVNLSVGLEEAIIAKEASNGGIEVGKVYYFVGSDGSNKTVAKARADVMTQAELCLGIAAESSTGGNKAFICTFGLVRNIDTNHLTEGAPVYLSSATAGELTATIPASPNYVVFVGYCIRKSATIGSVFVSINSGTHLEYLHDVKLTSPVGNNQVIIYDSALGYWKNSALSAIGVSSFSAGTTGFTPSVATTGAVTLAGTLDADNGGTGQSSYTVGDILYASGTTALSRLADVATGNALISGGVGVAPSWGKIGLTTHVSGTLGVGNGGTGITSGTSGGVPYFSSTSAIASSALLVNNAIMLGGGAGAAPKTTTTGTGVVTALGVNTGTAGAFVVNGGALGTPSSGTVTNLTGTASISINGTVGATTPNTGAFTTLSATGNVNFDGGSFVFNEAGADKDFRIEGDTDANLFFTDASTDRVGIGTSSPGTKLDLLAADNLTTRIRIGATQAVAASAIAVSEVFGTRNDSNNTFYGRFAASFRRCDATAIASGQPIGALLFGGQHGTDTSFQSAKLLYTAGVFGVAEGSFTSSTAMATGIAIYTGSTGGDIGAANNTFGTERMRINSSGDVGIGTTSPGAKLDVNGLIRSYAGASGLALGNRTTASQADRYTIYVTSDSLRLYDNTASSDRAVLNSNGEMIFGGTTDQGAYNLQCNGTGVWGAGAYVNGSDARIKENIQPLDSGMDVIQKINPVVFNYKEDWSSDRSLQTGFIAQDLLVALSGKEYADGIVQQNSEYMSVAYQSLIPILVKAIQELKTEFDAYKASHP